MEGQGDASEQKGLIAEKDDDSEEDLVGGGAMDVDPKAVGTGKSSKKRKARTVLNKAQVIPVSKLQQQPIKSKGSEEVGRIETFEGRLNELLDVVRGISKLRDSAKGYLKLLLLTAASRGGYAMAAHSSVHDNKAAHPFAECGTSLSVLPESLLEHMNTTQDMSDYLWQIFKFQQPEGAASVLIVNHTGHVLHAFFNGRFIGSMHGAFKAPRFLLETNFTLINGTNSIALLSVMVGLPNSRSVEIWNGKQALYFNNYSWGYQVGLHGEKSNVYSDDGAAKVQWKLYTNSKSQPLTWYKASFNTPEGRDPVALNLGTMGKGEAWVNGQSIGRYRVSFHTSKGSPSQTWYHIPMFKIARYCIAMALIANSDGIIALTTIAISTLYCERYDRFVAMVHGAMEEKDRNPLGITVDTVSVTKVCAHVSTSHPPPVTFWRRKYYSGTKHGHMKHWYDRRPKVHLQQRSLGRKISKLLSCLSVILEEDGSGEGILDTTSRIFIDGADAQMPQNKVLALDNCHSQSSVSTHASASGESSKRTGKNSKPPSKQQQQKPKEERIETDEEDDKESDEEHDEGEDDGRDDDPQNPIPQIRSSEPIQNWMDLENATVPADSGVKTEDVYGLIEGKLRSEGFTGPLKIDGIAGYTDFKAKNIAQENRLVVHHAKPFPRPPDTRGDQAADDHMDYKIDEWLDLRLPPQVTVIIAGDKGYKERMQKLRDAGHTTILIYTRNKVVGGNLDLQNQENARAIFGNPDHAWPWVSIFPGEESQVTARERRTKRFVDHMKSKKEDPEKRKMQRGKRLGGRNKEGHYKRERKKKARKAVEREKENPEKAEETQEMKAERKMNKLRNKSEKSKKYAEGARSVADGAEAVADAVNKAAAEEGTRSAKKVARIAEKVAADLRAAADRATENAEAAEEAWKEGKAKRKREEGGESSGEGPGTYKKRRLMN